MSKAPKRGSSPATYTDIQVLPENMVGQIIDGELHAMGRPAFGHAQAASFIGGDLMNPFGRGRGGPGGWLILFETELHFRRDVLVPDIVGWRRERLPSTLNTRTPWLEVAPDWVCEVLSPSTASIDRVKKKHIYAREGVTWYWLVDPDAQTLEVLKRGDDGHWVEVASWQGAETVRAAPFDAIELELGGLWVPAPPEP